MAGPHNFKPGVCLECGRPISDHPGNTIMVPVDEDHEEAYWDRTSKRKITREELFDILGI